MQYNWAPEDVGFFNSAYSSVSSEVTFVAMSVLLLGTMECGIFVIKFKTVGALRFPALSALLCSAPALLYSD